MGLKEWLCSFWDKGGIDCVQSVEKRISWMAKELLSELWRRYKRREQMIAYGEKPVGQIEVVKGFYFSARKKPCAWHRFWMRVFLGWKWHDGNVIGGEE